MALLRGSSLGQDGGQGQALVDRGILTKEELDHMHQHPCWQPQWILDVIRAIVVEAHKVPDGKGIVVDKNNKIHGQFVRCFDNGIKKLNDMIGDCVRTRASGLPASYDAITMTSFFTFFILASFVWSASICWMTPIIIAAASMVIMLLIVMGSKLVDPFGLDKVDIPMEAFCATVEAQVNAIDERAKDGTILSEEKWQEIDLDCDYSKVEVVLIGIGGAEYGKLAQHPGTGTFTVIFFRCLVFSFKRVWWQFDKRKDVVRHNILRQTKMERRTSFVQKALMFCFVVIEFAKN
eukprot:scaffold33962_cov171-Skeletonema_menzelii.AAC.2